MKIFAASISTETNTFAPAPTGLDGFGGEAIFTGAAPDPASAKEYAVVDGVAVIPSVAVPAPGRGVAGSSVAYPAPMSVVVRRADVAAGTGKEVDRLMTETPVAVDSPWLKQTAPAPETAKKHDETMRAHEIYLANQARVVEAEVWSKTLSDVKVEAAPAPVAKVEAPKEQPKGKGTSKTSPTTVTKGAAKAAGAPVAKVEPKAPKAEALASADAAKIDVSKAASSPSVLAAIDAGLGAEYAKIMAKKRRATAAANDEADQAAAAS
jgi:hypothetical protein